MTARSAPEFSPGAAGPLLADEENWQVRALCRGALDLPWFPRKGERPDPALAKCAACPVRALCLEEALKVERPLGPDHVWGIRGGLSAPQRQRILRAEIAAGLAPPKPRVDLCAKGLHEMDEANTSIQPNGGRRCMACRNAWAAQRDREKRYAARVRREAGVAA